MARFLRHHLYLLLTLVLPAWAADLPPDQIVKSTIQELLEVARNDRDVQAGNRQKVLAVAEAKVLPHFDFIRMTRLAVGASWRQATPEQQRQLVKEFRGLLVHTYLAALTDKSYAQYKDYTVEFEPFHMGPNQTDVSVGISLKHPGTPSTSVQYSMTKTPEGWKVYDVKVEGVSLVINYRASFTSQIRQSGIQGLIQTLAAKNRSLSSQL
jgi:phospholipid transport system substrate-binding protein